MLKLAVKKRLGRLAFVHCAAGLGQLASVPNTLKEPPDGLGFLLLPREADGALTGPVPFYGMS